MDESRKSQYSSSADRLQETESIFEILKGKFYFIVKLKTLSVTYIATQVPEKQIHELGMLFKQIDKNCDGFITVE